MANAKIEFARRIVAVIAAVFGVALTGFSETVTNVRGSQRESSKLVDIYYDLNDTGGGTYYVEVEVVGRTNDFNATSFSGDVGEGVTPGQNRRIVWDAGADWPGNKGDVKAVVTAIKGGKPNKVQLWEGGPYWADRNIGASAPWDYGLYFWWGDTVGYERVGNAWVASNGSSSNFSFRSGNACEGNPAMLQSEGWITTNGILAPSHDAAHMHWGSGWRIPTRKEFDNLNSKCDWTWTTMNGVRGYVVRGKGDYASNSIFLPCTGYGTFTSLYNVRWTGGYYWTSVPDPDTASFNSSAYEFYFTSDFHYANSWSRDYGQTVRPVK